MNDFVGQGYGALDLDLESEVVELMPGSISKINDLGPKVCVGAGTGLGECYLTRSSLAPDLGYECYPSEGGHVDFVPRDDLGVELCKHLREKFDGANRVSVERVVSGRGLANVYEFLAGRFPERVDKEIHETIELRNRLHKQKSPRFPIYRAALQALMRRKKKI